MSDQSNVQEREELEPQGQAMRAFDPNKHVIQLKSGQTTKDYLPVQWRLVWFRTVCPQGTIETEMLHLDLDRDTEEETFAWNAEKRRSEKTVKHANGFVVFRAVVRDGKGGVATGTKSEKAASFPDFIEKAETGAIGRALAALGYGTQFAPELDEAHRIVDSPVERYTPPANGNGQSSASNGSNGRAELTPVQANGNTPSTATEQQLASIRKLSEHLGKAEPEDVANMSFLRARHLIQQLTSEYKERQHSKAS
jgi:hypothetical protein